MEVVLKSLATASLVAGAGVSMLMGAPAAAASGAEATIADLQAEGYVVSVNYLNGQSKVLSRAR